MSSWNLGWCWAVILPLHMLKLNHCAGQILIFHQPRFSWNKEISLSQLPFEVRSCEVAAYQIKVLRPPYSSLFEPPSGFKIWKKAWKQWWGWMKIHMKRSRHVRIPQYITVSNTYDTRKSKGYLWERKVWKYMGHTQASTSIISMIHHDSLWVSLSRHVKKYTSVYNSATAASKSLHPFGKWSDCKYTHCKEMWGTI